METACPPRCVPPTAERPNGLGRQSLHRLPDARWIGWWLRDQQQPPTGTGIEELALVGPARRGAVEVGAGETSLDVDGRAAPQGARNPRARGRHRVGGRWLRHRPTGMATRRAPFVTD